MKKWEPTLNLPAEGNLALPLVFLATKKIKKKSLPAWLNHVKFKLHSIHKRKSQK
jgi:hypothetical protein